MKKKKLINDDVRFDEVMSFKLMKETLNELKHIAIDKYKGMSVSGICRMYIINGLEKDLKR